MAAAPPSSQETRSVPALLDTVARSLVAALDVSGCAISRIVGDLLVDIAGYSRGRERLFLGYGYLISDYPVTRDVLERRVARALSLHDPDVDEQEAGVLRDLGFDSLLMLPLLRGGTAWALVEIFATGGRTFEPGDIAAAETLLRDASAQLEQLTLSR